MNEWPPDEWDELAASIGALVLNGGHLEGTARRVLLTMMTGGGPSTWRRSQLVIEGYSASHVNERCKRLAKFMLAGALQDELLAWLEDVRQCQAYRNSIVHAE